MRCLLWNLYRVFAVLFIVAVLLLNARLYQSPDNTIAGIRPHLEFLKESLQAGSADRMQLLFPEGFLFNYQLYGASWISLALQQSELRTEAIKEARWALAAVESDEGKAAFKHDIEPAYGVFYLGWSNWLRGGILAIEPEAPEKAQFIEVCTVLADALDKKGPYLEAYPGQAWPCDTTVAVACLALHDTLFQPKFEGVISRWLEQVGQELFPHRVAPTTKATRGTSQVMIQRFLFEIEPQLAARQYRVFREKFVTTRFGLPGVREYPIGQDGPGDVDSGPLVFGFSFSSTGVVPGAARLHRDQGISEPFAQLIHTFGFPFHGRYLGGILPVADALLIWSRTACSWTGKSAPLETLPPVVGTTWRWGFHLFWLAVCLLVLLPWRLASKISRHKPAGGTK